MIEVLLSTRGVRYATLVDEKGAVVSSVGDIQPDVGIPTAAKAILGSLKTAMNASDWNDLLLDLDGGPVLLTPIGDQLLMTAFDDVASLGRVRFAVRRALGRV